MARQLKRLILALAAGVAAAGAIAAPAEGFEPRVPETFFGVSATELWTLSDQNRDAERDAQLDGMKAAGIDWARIEIGWPEVEPTAPTGGVHTYRWATADGLMAALASRNMELMALPMATPPWAASAEATATGCGRRSEVAQTRSADYAAFVEAIARRYGPNGSFWASRPDLPQVPVTRYEIWNEPNWAGFWCPEPDPEAFGAMLEQAADGIHAVDPSAQVTFGGLAALQDSKHSGGSLQGMAADEFLRRAVAQAPGLTGSLDSVGFHPYDIDPAMNLSMIGWLRRKMEDAGLPDAEIVLTEFGWRAGLLEGALSEVLRAANYDQMTSQVARTDCGVTAVAAHTWQSDELDLLNPDHWYGIVSPLTGLLHPSGAAYRDQVALFEGRGPTPAPRETITVCGEPAPPDTDGDGVPDADDDYPTDPDRWDGSEEEPPPPPEEEPEEPRTQVQRATDSFFGVTVVQLPDDFTRLGDEYAAMSSARIGTVRQRIVWSQIEPLAPTHPDYARDSQWNWLDRLVVKMADAGIRLQPSFGATPDWVPAGSFDAEYAAFMARFASRYGAGGEFWAENRHLEEELFAVRDYEIWQYGNLDAHAPAGTATAAGYAATYRAARSALRTVDGGAHALLSIAEMGQTGTAASFLGAMAAADPALAGSVDGVVAMAEHSRAVAPIEAMVRNVRYALENTGNAAAPIFLGFGAPVAGPEAISEADRAELYADVASRAVRGDCGVAGVFGHAWTTQEEDSGNSWHWFGIADKDDATLSPTAEAYRDTAAAFRGYGAAAAPAAAVHPCNGEAPDRDGDGTPDPADPAPLDPTVSAPTATPPAAPEIHGGPAPSPTIERDATFSLVAAGATEFQCKLDAGRFKACDAAPSFTGLSHGTHQLRARAVDSLGLVGPAAVKSWEVDIVGPEITAVHGPTVALTSRVEFRFSSAEASAQLACQLDGHGWEWCSSPKVYPFIGDGAHEFRAAAVDELGNVGPVELHEFEVRTEPGATTITSGPAEGATAGPNPAFRFRADYASSYECRFDAGAWSACGPAGAGTHKPPPPLTGGPHSFEVRGVGRTGTRGASAHRTFTVDASAPDVAITTKRAAGAVAVFALAATDTGSAIRGLRCKLDRGAWRDCGTPHRVRNLKPGAHRLRVRAIDAVGNRAEAVTRWRTPG